MATIDVRKIATSSRVRKASPMITGSFDTSEGSERGVSPRPVWRTRPLRA